ncbi:MAG: hypothetical protein ABIH41_07305 [Nanoarchaeota archaeon]
MGRKIIRLSPTTHVISLPTEWLRSNHLKKGDELTVTEHPRGLLLENKPFNRKREVELDLRGMQDDKRFAMVDAAYIAGYDQFRIRIDAEETQYVHRIINYFPGFVISEERKGTVTAKDISDPQAANADQITLRVHHMIVDMIRDGLEAYTTKEWKIVQTIKKRDYLINSYVSYAIRQLLREPKETIEQSLIHVLIKQAEEFADTAAIILETSAKKKYKEGVIRQTLAVAEAARQQWQERKNCEALFTISQDKNTDTRIRGHAFALYETGLQLWMLQR